MAKYISIRQFAREMGVSHTAINKAIKQGRIIEGHKKGLGIIREIAEQEYRDNTEPGKGRPPASKSRPRDGGGGEVRRELPPTEDSFAHAKKAKMVYEAQIKKLEFEEKSGRLVDKSIVYKELFAAGKELRISLLAIPDRIIDNLMACGTRNEAHAMLLKELTESLEEFADINKRLKI